MKSILVTGGAGFIGSNFVHLALAATDRRIVVLDKLTYAGSLSNLRGTESNSRFVFVKGDISDRLCLETVFREHQPAAILNFAASF